MAGYFSEHPNHPANIICELCRLYFDNNWVTGTGGGISIRDVDGPNPNVVYIAPSGIQKERLRAREMFVVELPSTILSSPNDNVTGTPVSLDLGANFKYKPSACTPLFTSIYEHRDAGACIHTHSQNAVMATLIWHDKLEFKISDIEQIKALPKLEFNSSSGKVEKVGSLQNFDTLVIPIVDNTPQEEDLTETLADTLRKYPTSTAVLVRRHGIHVWGETIWKAKVYNEAIDYLLELAIKMHSMGIPLVKSST